MYEAIEKNAKKSKTLWYGVKSPISAIAVHPHQSVIAVATDDGFIGIYDYLNNFDRKSECYITLENKKVDKVENTGGKRRPQDRVITCMEFTPTEGELLIGLSKGEIRIIDGEDFKLQELSQPLKITEEQKKTDYCIKQLIVTQDGKYFATSDTKNCVCLFKKGRMQDDENAEILWYFTGKILSH